MPLTKPVPPDPDEQNEDRSYWAQTAVTAFQKICRTDDEDALCDLLCDLAHWADRNDMSLPSELRRAMMHYEEEAPGGKQFYGVVVT